MHTTETDGKSTLEQMAEAALGAGRSYVAITDHSESLTFVRGLTKERLRAQTKKLREVEEKMDGRIRLFTGIEADILADGSLDLDDALGELDWVVGSVHSHLNMPREEMTRRVVRAIESGKIDCLGHATGRQLGVRDGAQMDMELVLAAARRAGIAVELNSSPLRLDVDEHTCRMAREMGVPVVINSDAHGIRELSYLRYGVGIARRAWLGKKHVLNTKTAEELQEWRRARAS